ncbi:3244_t:CDS:2, partial [Funneliformis caledonium]
MLQPSTIKRRLNTQLNEFKRARQIWSELNDNGITTANSLMNIKLQERQIDYSLYWKEELDNLPNLEEKNHETENETYKNLLCSLHQIFEKMSLQYTKMKMQTLQMESLLEETCESMGEEFTYNTSLYLTCPLETF